MSSKSFNVGDEIKGDIVPKCRAACRCSKHGDAANIECANVECPELFGRRNWDCLSIYENPKQCCRSEEICGSLWFCTYRNIYTYNFISIHIHLSHFVCFFFSIQDKAKIRAINTCEVEGKTYHLGERIYPDNSCYECHCALDYNNATSYADNSNCVKINCGNEIYQTNSPTKCKSCLAHRDFRLCYILWVKLATDPRRGDLSEENKVCNEVGNHGARCDRQFLHFVENDVKTRKKIKSN